MAWTRLRLVTTPYSPTSSSQAATAYGRKLMSPPPGGG